MVLPRTKHDSTAKERSFFNHLKYFLKFTERGESLKFAENSLGKIILKFEDNDT